MLVVKSLQMGRIQLLISILLPMLTACTQAISPEPTLPPPIPRETAVVTATPTDTPTPTSTPLPPIEAIYYQLRLELTTTSDWTTLEIQNSTTVLTMRFIETDGDPTHFLAGLHRLLPEKPINFVLSLNQPIGGAEAGESVGIKVDLAVSPEALDDPPLFVLDKGALGVSTLRVYEFSDGDFKLLQEIESTELFTLPFNLQSLGDSLPLQATIPRLSVQKMIWAFYYPWYRTADWNSRQLRDRPAIPYPSSDPTAIARHIEQAQDAGIDGFISSWWGPNDFTDYNLQKLLELAKERNFWVTIYLETLGADGPRNEEQLYDWLRYAISKYGEHPAFIKVMGKPLVVVWASGTVPLSTWERIFARLREEGLDAAFLAMGYDLSNLEVFAGLHDYGVFTIPDLTTTFLTVARAVRYYSLLGDPGGPKVWVATVQPGYDERLIPGRPGLFQDREAGSFYRATFEAALQSDPDWIFITSWNEWWEHTYIEPSELYGDQYLQITRELADRWKGRYTTPPLIRLVGQTRIGPREYADG